VASSSSFLSASAPKASSTPTMSSCPCAPLALSAPAPVPRATPVRRSSWARQRARREPHLLCREVQRQIVLVVHMVWVRPALEQHAGDRVGAARGEKRAVSAPARNAMQNGTLRFGSTPVLHGGTERRGCCRPSVRIGAKPQQHRHDSLLLLPNCVQQRGLVVYWIDLCLRGPVRSLVNSRGWKAAEAVADLVDRRPSFYQQLHQTRVAGFDCGKQYLSRTYRDATSAALPRSTALARGG
jgi:hypothetical protein